MDDSGYVTTTYTFDGANQLVSSTTDGVTTRYVYDAAGRLVKEGDRTYRYGYLDKVLSVSGGGKSFTYSYHADGQLARADYGDGRSEDFLWDGLALVRRGDESFVNEPHVGDAPKKLRFGGKPRAKRSARRARKGPRGNPVLSSEGVAYLNDLLGTTVCVRDGPRGRRRHTSAALTAFGEPLPGAEGGAAVPSPFFTGKPDVPGLGRVFLFRNYRPGLAKWQTADPLGYPDGWNQLAYCGNQLDSFVDLRGAHPVPVSGNGLVFWYSHQETGLSFAVRVWGECGGLDNPYIQIKTSYYPSDGEINDLAGLSSFYTIVNQEHGWDYNMFGGVAIWASFELYISLIYTYRDDDGILHSEMMNPQVRFGEFHCEHEREIFE